MIELVKLCVLPVTVIPLCLDDLDDLMPIERASFALPWPRNVYHHEFTKNTHGHYLAVHPALEIQHEVKGVVHLPRLLAYGGFWRLHNEAHVCTLATHPRYRKRGLGEWLLLHLLDLAEEYGLDIATLEVRASNLAAQRLYQRTGFRQVGVRRRYYSNNHEDALIMTTPLLASPEMQALLAQRREIVFARLCEWTRKLAKG
jgi:ribosomal-protein-alanine N-acetyltransferase